MKIHICGVLPRVLYIIMHIAIAGNIGAGKTTLTKMLAKRYGWKAHFEPVDHSIYKCISLTRGFVTS